MDWITEHVAVGNFIDARDVTDADVDAILCLRPGCDCEERDDVDAVVYPLADGPGNRREDVLEAIDFVHGCVQTGERVLVHCHAGRSRSVCVVAAWLALHRGRTRSEALQMIADKRPIYLSPGVEEILDLAGVPRG